MSNGSLWIASSARCSALRRQTRTRRAEWNRGLQKRLEQMQCALLCNLFVFSRAPKRSVRSASSSYTSACRHVIWQSVPTTKESPLNCAFWSQMSVSRHASALSTNLLQVLPNEPRPPKAWSALLEVDAPMIQRGRHSSSCSEPNAVHVSCANSKSSSTETVGGEVLVELRCCSISGITNRRAETTTAGSVWQIRCLPPSFRYLRTTTSISNTLLASGCRTWWTRRATLSCSTVKRTRSNSWNLSSPPLSSWIRWSMRTNNRCNVSESPNVTLPSSNAESMATAASRCEALSSSPMRLAWCGIAKTAGMICACVRGAASKLTIDSMDLTSRSAPPFCSKRSTAPRKTRCTRSASPGCRASADMSSSSWSSRRDARGAAVLRGR
mmetsp:Transcript_150985/g.263040  ORF Transcript_150985/g.263040 Transcript_150985/m.263040 type:complete len:383 (+) Transcript_150985:227-1375(+)